MGFIRIREYDEQIPAAGMSFSLLSVFVLFCILFRGERVEKEMKRGGESASFDEAWKHL